MKKNTIITTIVAISVGLLAFTVASNVISKSKPPVKPKKKLKPVIEVKPRENIKESDYDKALRMRKIIDDMSPAEKEEFKRGLISLGNLRII